MKTYVQLGSNVGNDHFQKMVESLSDRSFIVLVEPNPHIKPILNNAYVDLASKHKIVICTYGVSDKTGEGTLYFYWDHVLSSMIRRKTTESDPTSEIKIQTITFQRLCEMCEITEIEQLSIDTEGLDYQILLSIDIEKINIREIIFEEWWPENDDKNGVYETGPVVLERVKEKYKDYNWEKIVLDNMQNYKLTKK